MASLKPRRVDFASTWSTLRETLLGVVGLHPVARSTWNERFSDVYALCVAYPEPLADALYNELKAFLEEHVAQLRNNKVDVNNRGVAESGSHGNRSVDLLTTYHEEWTRYSEGVRYLHQLFSYLNNQHIRKQRLSEAEINYGGGGSSSDGNNANQMKEIGELGLDIWLQEMIRPLREKLVHLLLEAIRNDRVSEFSNDKGVCSVKSTSVIHGVIKSFVDVEEYRSRKKDCHKLYEEIFEKPFLMSTGEYYREEALSLLQEHSVSQYMERVIQRIASENVRSRKFLSPTSYKKVTSEVEQRMVGAHMSLLNSECQSVVSQERRNDLANMYVLLKPIHGAQQVLLDELHTHIKTRGIEAISGLKNDHIEFVDNVLTVYNKYRRLIAEVFNNDQAFIGAMDRAMAVVINYRMPKQIAKSPELLARYCDALLRKSAKGMSENEIEEKLNESITVFKYLDDKDIFQKFYSIKLGKRLIHQQSHSMDLEESMINRLKQACGYEFTNKFHRMFTDISLAEDLNSKFTDYLRTNNALVGINYFVRVLQQGAWPLSQTGLSPLNIPAELEKTVTMYEAFHAKQFSGRKLTWIHHLSNADVKLCYLPKTYIVNMSTFQMAILLLFERSDSLSFGELQKTTNIQEDHFTKYLQSLIESKLLTSNTESLSSSSLVALNTSYSNKRTKFRISGGVQRETSAEVEQTHVAVDEDRKMFIQAAIVRIMKSRKLLKHNQLIQEVLSQSKSRFAPSIPMIKKCIESLIDKAYLERAKNAPDEYSYVA